MYQSNKKIIAVLLLIGFLLARTYDLSMTYYHSPDLTLEANPFVVLLGQTWANIITLQAIVFVIIFATVYRLGWHHYHTPLIEERINHKLFNKPITKTPKYRYLLDFTFAFGVIIASLFAGSTWFSSIWYTDGFDWFLGLQIGILPISAIVILFISVTIAYLIGNKVVDKYLPELNSPSPN